MQQTAEGVPPPEIVRDFRAVDRVITEERHIPIWQQSPTFTKFVAFLTNCNNAIKNKKCSDVAAPSAFVLKLVTLLNKLEEMLKEFPPIQQPQRFGNKGFRNYFTALCERTNDLLREALPENAHAYVDELGDYFVGSFGNATRLDYGTGHECSFLVMLHCMHELNLFAATDLDAIPLVVTARYLKLCRSIQRTYMLEPAGSHGVWSLDDYQFVCFLWGSGQLVGQNALRPNCVLDEALVRNSADDYLYFAGVEYVKVTKKGPFFETSPVLHSLATTVVSWDKINQGMFKMYHVEVLGKHPIMQHLRFGTIFKRPANL